MGRNFLYMNILLLEDDLILSSEISKFLEQKEVKCTRAFTGLQFMELFSMKKYDVFLLDIHVPNSNGLDICSMIREHDKEVPILMISAYGSISDKVEAYNRFADDYLVKPFHLDELWMKMNSLLRRTNKKEQDEVITIEDLVINKSQRNVFRAGNEIQLTLKEFQLLVFLAEAKGRVVSKQQISEQVWEHNFNTNTNTVEVYINFLRKKIDKDFSVKLIHTRSGFGYFLSNF